MDKKCYNKIDKITKKLGNLVNQVYDKQKIENVFKDYEEFGEKEIIIAKKRAKEDLEGYGMCNTLSIHVNHEKATEWVLLISKDNIIANKCKVIYSLN